MLLLLGTVITLAFGVLFLAIVTYTQVTVSGSRAGAVLQLAELMAQQDQSAAFPSKPLQSLSTSPLVDQVALYSPSGERIRATKSASSSELPQTLKKNDLQRRSPWTESGSELLVFSPGRTRTGAALGFLGFLVAQSTPRTQALNPLLAIYMGLVALLLLTGVYFTVTHWIIQPLSELSLKASHVATKKGSLVLARPRSRELAVLSKSLAQMHSRLQQDETALRNKVAEVESATEQLATAQRQLVRSERLASVGQLSAGLAHEIGNPIAAMQGLQELILQGDLDRDQELDFVRRMRKETERVSRILSDLLQFARVEQSGSATTNSGAGTAGTLARAIEETVALTAPQPLFRNMKVQVLVPAGLSDVALCHGHLVQVLLNLVLNAGQACKGSGTLILKAIEADGTVILTVEDDGPGVPPALGDRVFEPFVSSKDVGEGTGLGLSVCRGLIESAGGSVDIDLKTGAGARFIIHLPTASSNRSPIDTLR